MTRDDSEEGAETFTREDLQDAFVAGFITGRTGRYYSDIAGISRRAAHSEFEQYVRHKDDS